MDLLKTSEITNEIEKLEKPLDSIGVTFYLPTSRVWSENEKNLIKLKNLINKAEELLKDSKVKASERKNILNPLRNLVAGKHFWKDQKEGLAIFATKGLFKFYKLPYSFTPQVHVGKKFNLAQLKGMAKENVEFYLLILSKNRVELYECVNQKCKAVEDDDLPTNIDEILWSDDPEKSIQHHETKPYGPGRKGGMTFHGHGQIKEALDTNIERYLKKVARIVENKIYYEDKLVLATTKENYEMFKSISKHKRILEEFIEGNPNDININRFVKKAYEIVKQKK